MREGVREGGRQRPGSRQLVSWEASMRGDGGREGRKREREREKFIDNQIDD
jgi:hypothetical protein